MTDPTPRSSGSSDPISGSSSDEVKALLEFVERLRARLNDSSEEAPDPSFVQRFRFLVNLTAGFIAI